MFLDKITSIKNSIIESANLRSNLENIKDNINKLKDQEEIDIEGYDFKVLVNMIVDYFYQLSSNVFDAFVCEGGDADYSYKNFKIFYLNIYYSFLKDFFISDSEISYFFNNKISNATCSKIYAMCEDSLFNFISLYYFNTKEIETKNRVEHILNNIIQFDCDSKEKEYRYKKILFTHYKETTITDEIGYLSKLNEKLKNIQHEFEHSRKEIKELKSCYYTYKSLPESFKESYSRDDIKNKFIPTEKQFLISLNEKYKEMMKLRSKQIDKINYYKNLTQEEFENYKQ